MIEGTLIREVAACRLLGVVNATHWAVRIPGGCDRGPVSVCCHLDPNRAGPFRCD